MGGGELRCSHGLPEGKACLALSTESMSHRGCAEGSQAARPAVQSPPPSGGGPQGRTSERGLLSSQKVNTAKFTRVTPGCFLSPWLRADEWDDPGSEQLKGKGERGLQGQVPKGQAIMRKW